jgi:hypothetical protein
MHLADPTELLELKVLSMDLSNVQSKQTLDKYIKYRSNAKLDEKLERKQYGKN